MSFDYKIIRSSRRTLAIEIKKDASVTVRAPFSVSNGEIREFVNKKSAWIEKHLKEMKESKNSEAKSYTEKEIKELKTAEREIILPLAEYYSELLGVKYKSIKFNRAKTRFGSCSRNNSLNFSCFLMLYPREAIEYVVVHELCHIREHNHSKRFYALVKALLPDYKEREKLLKTGGKNN